MELIVEKDGSKRFLSETSEPVLNRWIDEEKVTNFKTAEEATESFKTHVKSYMEEELVEIFFQQYKNEISEKISTFVPKSSK